MYTSYEPRQPAARQSGFKCHALLLEVLARKSYSVFSRGLLRPTSLRRNTCSPELIRDADRKATAQLATLIPSIHAVANMGM